ncbi:hypothetical protein SAV31267_092260 [Streptomyces avermitilis]|nr:hypothetical protein SAVMC3_07720 [Streptomyces avermitilis]GDY79741.1 hypothetical protein SAV31267_092260 [Streptomyces avermitilis]
MRASAPQEAPNGGATVRKALTNHVLRVGRITRIRLLGSIRQRSGRGPCWFPAPAEPTGSAPWWRGKTPPEPGSNAVAEVRTVAGEGDHVLGLVREPRDDTPRGWPWGQEAARAEPRRKRIGGAWPLGFATLAVLAAGYAWLGFVVEGVPGALVGCAAGLILSGLLCLLVDSAVSAPRPAHRRVHGAAEDRGRLRSRS